MEGVNMITPEWGSLKTVVLVRVTITIGLGSDPRASGVLSGLQKRWDLRFLRRRSRRLLRIARHLAQRPISEVGVQSLSALSG